MTANMYQGAPPMSPVAFEEMVDKLRADPTNHALAEEVKRAYRTIDRSLYTAERQLAAELDPTIQYRAELIEAAGYIARVVRSPGVAKRFRDSAGTLPESRDLNDEIAMHEADRRYREAMAEIGAEP